MQAMTFTHRGRHGLTGRSGPPTRLLLAPWWPHFFSLQLVMNWRRSAAVPPSGQPDHRFVDLLTTLAFVRLLPTFRHSNGMALDHMLKVTLTE